MNAMILAAGLGTRLGELGKEKPKVLMDVQGEPLLNHHLHMLEAGPFDRVIINAHHQAEQILSYTSQYQGPLEIISIREHELLGTAGAVHNALPWLGEPPFLILYGDIFFPTAMRMWSDETTIGVYQSSSAEGMGIVEVDECDRVTKFIEKGSQSSGLVNAGVYILHEDIVPLLRPHSDFGYDIFPEAIEQGIEILAWRLLPVIDIGTPERLASVQ